MTPSARLSAAIEILDRVLAGASAEQALTNWGRASRFAGSGDRAAVRDLVFEALRCRRSFAAMGGPGGRGLILGGLRAAGTDPVGLFTGEGHAPAPLTEEELEPHPPLSELEALDCPDWLAPQLRDSLGERFAPVMQALRHRAPVFLRVNTARCSLEEARQRLAVEAIIAEPHPLAATALQVTAGARKIHASRIYAEGLVELQDAASQAVVEALPLVAGQRVLDYCAGGGGKTLAMAARARLALFAHDADPGRMRDLPVRAERAGERVALLDGAAVSRQAPFDLVLADAPCSGSGSWRRAPEAKWALTEARLQALCALQADILDRVALLVAPGGHLAYATCSLLSVENEAQVEAFLVRHPGWQRRDQRVLTPLDGGDGFFLSLLAAP
ncbi:RsmB/NOP family class I SAM-dependent RNA methyltransferase [Cereibacter changlensis]|uniref:RsmB/NOP family class I SAM-dependent RNA methyltransferase n=1 Tax=Cereibacter changlensis TaxID=402884 RepID=UPI004033F011